MRTPSADAVSDADASKATDHNVGGWIARWAHRTPSRPAWSDDRRRTSYAEAEERVQRTVGALLRWGLQPVDRVGLWLHNRVELLECLFASARLGAITLPVNARLTPTEIAFQLDDCEPRFLFVESEWATQADTALAAMQSASKPRVIVLDDDWTESLGRETPSAQIRAVSPEDPMMLMYTSGTTGHPKGALLPHRKALYNSLNAEIYFDLHPRDRALVVAPLFHSLALQILSLPSLYCGASVHLQEGFDARRVWETVESEGISFLGGVPTMHERLLAGLDSGVPFSHPPASLRFVFTAGSAAPGALLEGFARHGIAVQQGYGQTETSILTCQRPGDGGPPGTVGRPVRHAEIRLIDPRTLADDVRHWRDVLVDEVGEVVARGPITMLGYWKRPEATAETLREGWVLTGDLALRDPDFNLKLVGRSREMYISGGENVYPAEVEAVLEEHPGIHEVAVLAMPDATWGEAGRAFVVPASKTCPTAGDILEWLDARLARYKRPREIVFIDALPRTASGKVQKQRLAASVPSDETTA